MAPRGKPSVATTTWYLVPSLPRPVGLRPVRAPPRLALTEQLSTTTSHAATSGTERTIRSRATWTRRSTAVALQSLRRRRKGEPQARPAVARSSRHCTPSRTKNRRVSTILMVGMGGRPVPSGRSSIWSMIPATNAAALDAMSVSRCQRHGKRTRGQPDAQRLTIVQGSGNRALVPGNMEAWPQVRDRLSCLLGGWAAYFSYGTRLMAYRAVDNHVYELVRYFLVRSHKMLSRGSQQVLHPDSPDG